MSPATRRGDRAAVNPPLVWDLSSGIPARRAGWKGPKHHDFGLAADAWRFAYQATMYEPSKIDGPVVSVEIQERLISAWTVIHQVELREADATSSTATTRPRDERRSATLEVIDVDTLERTTDDRATEAHVRSSDDSGRTFRHRVGGTVVFT